MEETKPSVMDKVHWLLSHNKNYTKEQYHTLQELEEQLEKVTLMTENQESYVGRGTYDDMDELMWEINDELKGE